MADKLVSPQRTIDIIRKYEFSFRKKLGQNFLIDERVIERIIAAAKITKEDCVLEIGPGIGALTQYLAQAAGQVVAVEIDRKLIPILEETLGGAGNVSVINRDILKTDLQEIADTYNGGQPLKVVANLPYYITTPILMELLEKKAPISSVTVMVQREVADRMLAKPGSKTYGALSLAVQYYTQPEIVAIVPPNCFIPRPSVDSAVVKLGDVGAGRVPVRNEKLMFALIRAAFNQRRKTLANGIKNAGNLAFSREQVTEALLEMGLPATVRGETLSPEQFAQLADLLDEGE